jgi:Xaa-Pro aminopeptidase
MTQNLVLDGLLAEAGSRLGAADLAALLEGVAAAPEGLDPEAWMALVGPKVGPELRDRLRPLYDAARRPKPAAAAIVGRLAALRAELARRGLAGFVVPRADEHQGEYVPPRAERLAWITGFTGSAGLAIVLADKAAMFVDGRYTIQVRQQVDEKLFACRHLTDEPPDAWVAENLPKGGKLGYDPWLHTPDQLEPLKKAAAKAGGELTALADNPLDAVWIDQPPPPISPVRPHDIAYTGKESAAKRQEIAAKLAELPADAAVLTGPDSIAWLLNLRGADVPRTPLPLSFALLHIDGRVDLFIDKRKLVPGVEAHLGNAVAVRAPGALGAALDDLGRAKGRVLADPAGAAAWIFDRLAAAGAEILRGPDPCALPKACKNAVEVEGARAAHLRDGAAVTRFLRWLAREAPKGGLTEIAAADKLAEFRRADPLLRDFSFDTISAAGPNAAIPHYRVTPESNRPIECDRIYLVDSGAQYLDGTTDITRTVIVGQPTAEMRDRFTRVLKGHIALGSTRFPRGTTGSQLDALARAALWAVGLDYDHGTGHGVGSYLGVHEGPQRISKIPNRIALAPGMIVSNEPGYYKSGDYGIRIENLVAVAPVQVAGAERPMLGFETLTLAPIDRALIAAELLTPEERAWVNAYHARVRDALTPLLDADTAAWLKSATATL